MPEKNAHVLLVEDSEEHTILIRSILDSLGATTTHCGDGESAFKILSDKKNIFDLLIVDVTLPGMTGFELAQKAKEKRVQTPVIFITGHATQTDVVQGVLLGASDYIKKPFSPPEVRERIRLKLHVKKAAA